MSRQSFIACDDVAEAVSLSFCGSDLMANPAVVVADPARHTAEELKGPLMSRLKRLRAFAREDLHVDYMFWVRIPKDPVIGAYNWYDALPVIEANAVF